MMSRTNLLLEENPPAGHEGARRLRVLHLGKYYPPHRGGMETHLEMLCQQLKEFADVEVIVANGSSRNQEVEEHRNGIPITRLRTLIQLRSAPICRGMVKAIRKSRADIVHLHHPNPLAMLAWIASRHPAPLVLTYHSDVVRQRLMWPLFRPVCDYVMSRTAAILTTSPNYIEHSEMLRRHAERCHVVPLGISVNEIDSTPHEAIEKVRAQFGPRFVLGVGRLVYYKGFEYLIRAMQTVNANLVLIGTGPLHRHLGALARTLGIAHRVHFLGDVPDVMPFYHACDVFALPSIAPSEAFGLVQLEAMACRRPVVNTNLSTGVPFVSRHGITGLTVPPADHQSLAGAIGLLLGNLKMGNELGNRGRERVIAEFSEKVMAERTLALYRGVLRTEPAGSLARQR
jgi:rhamnosyl/mannosyltransferase